MKPADLNRPVRVRLWGVALGGFLLALSLAGNALSIAVSESASDTASETRTLVQPLIIRNSVCASDPRGDECQALFAQSIRAFDRKVACLLSRKLGIDCIRRQQAEDERSERAESSADEGVPEPRPGTSTPGAAGGPGGGDGGGDSPGSNPPDGQPNPPNGNGNGSPEPPSNPPPDPPDRPSNPPSVGGGVGKALEGTGEIIDATQTEVCNRLGVCLR